jgi:hypothetical protein
MLLAADISFSTGVAWGRMGDVRPRTALYKLTGSDLDRALVQLDEAITMICRMETVTHFVFEASMRLVNAEHGYDSAFTLISLQAVARRAATRAGALVYPVNVGTWRKHFIGSGNLPGPVAKKKAQERCTQLGYTFQNVDAAEACGVWDYGVHTYCRKDLNLKIVK